MRSLGWTVASISMLFACTGSPPSSSESDSRLEGAAYKDVGGTRYDDGQPVRQAKGAGDGPGDDVTDPACPERKTGTDDDGIALGKDFECP